MKIIDHDAITGESVERDATAEEIEAAEQAKAEMITAAENQAKNLEARKEPLRRLGLTEDEINIVLGV